MSETKGPKRDFFVSYSQEDREWALWIGWVLNEAGYSTILDVQDFGPGKPFPLRMHESIEQAERMIAVLSPDYLDSEFAMAEWEAFWVKDPRGKKALLVPLRVQECDLKGLVGPIIFTDMVGKNEDGAKRELLDALNRAGVKPVGPPEVAAAPGLVKPNFPGTLPPIWNVPHDRNLNFTGREELIRQLRKALTDRKATAITQAITGLGGVGKTQLAMEYAYRHAGKYKFVWWLRSEEPAVLASDYAALAYPLNLPQKDSSDQREIAEAVKRKLVDEPRWLLIFDNARDRDEVRDYIPPAGTGHVIITSRNPIWGGVAEKLSVKVWNPTESVEFLTRRTGQEDTDAVKELAEELGHLPLALEQAGSYIEQTERPLFDYLKLFRERQQELLKLAPPSTRYKSTVATTWEISFQEVEKTSPAGADLMNLCGFLAPDAIPLDIIREGKEHLPKLLREAADDPIKLDEAVAALLRYSLVEREGDSLNVHRLVQAVARDRLEDKARKTWAEASLHVVKRAFPEDSREVHTWPTCSRLLGHALAVAEHTQELRVAPEARGLLLYQGGAYLRWRGDFSQAKMLLGRALEILEAAYPSPHPNVARVLDNLGFVHRGLGDQKGALRCVEQAVQIYEASGEEDRTELAKYINNLGVMLHYSGDLKGARERWYQFLEMMEEAYGPDHPEMALPLQNLGFGFLVMGNQERAREHIERALDIHKRNLGPDHPVVALNLKKLGHVFRVSGDFGKARECYERALEIVEGTHGPDHPELATTLNDLGLVLQQLGDLDGARRHLERSIEIIEARHGPMHPDMAAVLDSLGMLLRDLGDPKAAQEHVERALRIVEGSLGPDQICTGWVLTNLGLLRQDLGDQEGAREHWNRAIGILREQLGEGHPDTTKVREYLESLGA